MPLVDIFYSILHFRDTYIVTFAEQNKQCMGKQLNLSRQQFEDYVNSFAVLTDEQKKNFSIKKEHSLRVAEIAYTLSEKQKFSETDQYLAYIIGLFHDIGRFKQLIEYNTFNDAKSIDHADFGVDVLKDEGLLNGLTDEQIEIVFIAIQYHNKRELPKEINSDVRLLAQMIRDADKLDILKVLSDYYANPKAEPNHTLTWEMPGGNSVSPQVARQILKGSLVSKENVANQLDIKVMQLSWVYDVNFKSSFEFLMKNRYLEKIYGSMPKNDTVIEIYRKVKVYAENKFIE